MAKKDENGLNPREERFCRRYCTHLNRALAYIEAGYTGETNSESDLKTRVHRLFHRPEIQARIAYLNSHLEDLGMDTESVLREIALHAMADLSEIYDEKGNLKPLSEIPAHARRLIHEIRREQQFDGKGRVVGEKVQVKASPKAPYLKMLGEALGVFRQRVDVTSGGERVPVVFVTPGKDE